MVTDPIADMLTRIRNANQMRDKEVEVPASNLKIEIAKILKEEGFVNDYKIKKNNVQNIIVINLKYTENNDDTKAIPVVKKTTKKEEERKEKKQDNNEIEIKQITGDDLKKQNKLLMKLASHLL